MNICVTGHRPPRLYGYDIHNEKWNELKELFKQILIDPSSVVVLGKFRRFHLPIFSLFLPNLVFSYIYGIFSMPFGGFFY